MTCHHRLTENTTCPICCARVAVCKRRGIIARGSEVARRQNPQPRRPEVSWARSMPPKQQHASAAQPAPRSMPLAQRVTDARHDDAGQDSADDSGAVDSGEPAVVARAEEAECCDDEFICLDALRCIALAAIGFLVGFGITLWLRHLPCGLSHLDDAAACASRWAAASSPSRRGCAPREKFDPFHFHFHFLYGPSRPVAIPHVS